MRKNIWHSCWSNWLISNKNTSRAHMLPGFLDIVTARLFQICYTTIMSVKGAFICMWFIIFGIIFFIEGIIMTVYGVKKKKRDAHIYRHCFQHYDIRRCHDQTNRPLIHIQLLLGIYIQKDIRTTSAKGSVFPASLFSIIPWMLQCQSFGKILSIGRDRERSFLTCITAVKAGMWQN